MHNTCHHDALLLLMNPQHVAFQLNSTCIWTCNLRAKTDISFSFHCSVNLTLEYRRLNCSDISRLKWYDTSTFNRVSACTPCSSWPDNESLCDSFGFIPFGGPVLSPVDILIKYLCTNQRLLHVLPDLRKISMFCLHSACRCFVTHNKW
jgi:hypothetical protein